MSYSEDAAHDLVQSASGHAIMLPDFAYPSSLEAAIGSENRLFGHSNVQACSKMQSSGCTCRHNHMVSVYSSSAVLCEEAESHACMISS